MQRERQRVGEDALPQRAVGDAGGLEHVEPGGLPPHVDIGADQPAVALAWASRREDVLLGDLVPRVGPGVGRAPFRIEAGDRTERPAVLRAAAGERENLAVPPPGEARVDARELGDAGRRVLDPGAAPGAQTTPR